MEKGKLCLWGGVFGTALGGSWIVNAAGREDLLNAGMFLFLVSLFVLIPVGLHSRSKAKREAYNALSEVEKERIAAARERAAEESAEKLKQMKEERRAANTIVSTAIVDTTTKSKTKASASSSVVRGAVGGALFGGVGMVVGAVTPKKTTITKAKTVTFSVRYANGECKLETVKNGSARFNELAKYIA
jgi:hypothetical protein